MKKEYESLNRFAKEIRYETLSVLNNLKFGHYGGSLSIVETLAVLYGKVMPMTPELFEKKERDYFVLSKGHAGPSLYATLYLKGFFDRKFLHSLNTNGTSLPSHPDRNLTPGVDMTTGSLGQGISAATGIAKGQKILNMPYYTYCIVGDGELNEGQCWEAIQFAAHHQLNNLFVFVDDNKMQLDDSTKNICDPFDFVSKFRAFGWEAVRVDGANVEEIDKTIEKLKKSNSVSPKAIVLDTVKGHGIEYIEKMSNNHHLRLNDQMLADLKEIENQLQLELGGKMHE